MNRERTLVVACLVPLLGIFASLYLPLIPNAEGSLAPDFSVWLSELLVGDYWYANNALSALPWFSPAVCAGVPFFPDPQVPYVSPTQALTLLVSPVTATQVTILAAAGAGFLGAYALARLPFRASPAAALVAGVLFMFNTYFATRMLMGHLPFAPFMLMPALLLAALPWPGTRGGAAGEGIRVGCVALLVAFVIEAGAIHIVVPAMLTAGYVLLLTGLTVGWSWRAVARLAAGAVLGAALSAAKLAASFALLANYSRDFYALPGFVGLWNASWLPVQMLFLGPPEALRQVLYHNPYSATNEIVLERHEFEYGVTPVPAILVLAALAAGLVHSRGRLPMRWDRWLCLAGLLLLAAVPIAVNAHAPGWTEWLKTLPVLHSASNLLRWFGAYILPVTLAAALALDRLAGRWGAMVAVPVAAVSCLFVLVWLERTDLTFYENKAFGATGFQVASIEKAWAALHAGGAVPPVTSLNYESEMSFAASFTSGQSQLLCYWPLFGYALEDMPAGTLHPGDALVVDAKGRLNLRDPVCDVFPAENACRKGDQFPAEDRPAAEAMLHYRPFPFSMPWWMTFALWLNAASVLLLAVALPLCIWLRWRKRRTAAG